MKDDIATIRTALTAAKTIAYDHRRGSLHKLWPQLDEAIEALDRIEKRVVTTQITLTLPDGADYQRGA